MNSFDKNYSFMDDSLTTLFKKRKLLGEFMDYEDPYLARGDPDLEISNYVLDTAGSETGFFCFLIMSSIFFLLN